MVSITPIDVANQREQFVNAKPFPHIVIDDLWENENLERVVAEFPPGDDPRWITYPAPEEVGKRAGDARMWGHNVHEQFHRMRSEGFVRWLETITEIGPLTPDDIGGGMHMTGEGGRLEMHVDFNQHPTLPLERRLNVLIFLNHEWDESWGGTLYLGAEREVAVKPLFNRTVIFATSEESWHGHPEPIVGDHWRRSLAMYYYAPLRVETVQAHTTIWHQ